MLTWRQLAFSLSQLTGLHYKEMVQSVWGPIVAALSVVLDCIDVSAPASEPGVEEEVDLKLVLHGVGLCGRIAARVQAQEALEALCFNLHRRAQLGLGQTDLTPRTPCDAGGTTRASSELAVAAFGRSRKSQESLASLLQLCTAHGPLLKAAWSCVLDSLLTLFCTNLLALPAYTTAAPSGGSRSGASATAIQASTTMQGSAQGQGARASKQLSSARAPNGRGKAGTGWFSPLALWGGASQEKHDVDEEGLAAARAGVRRMLGDVGLFFSEVPRPLLALARVLRAC